MHNFMNLFKGKRVLVTGDTGFKGSWLSFWLHELGADVVGLSLPPYSDKDHYCVINLEGLIHHINCDIREHSDVEDVFQNFQPEFLFHLAAQPLVRYSFQEPKLTFDTNLGGSINILEVARNTPSLKSIIFVTSDKCYQNNEWVWGYRETDRLGGHDPYSASKAAAELVFAAYQKSFFSKNSSIGVASVRAGNVIGGGDWAKDRIVPDSIKSILNNVPIKIRSPKSTRPWQHVLEPLSGYLKLSAYLFNDPTLYSGAWNFGPSSHSFASVQDLVDLIVNLWGKGNVIVNEDPSLHEANLLHLNCDKAHNFLKWFPRWDFIETVNNTVQWYKDTSIGKSGRLITHEQIKHFMKEDYDD